MVQPITVPQLSARLTPLIKQLSASEITSAVFQAALTEALFDWVVGGISNAQIAAGMSHWLKSWKQNNDGVAAWLAGSATYVAPVDTLPNPQPFPGWYPFIDPSGNRVWMPSLAKISTDFKGLNLRGYLDDPALLPGAGNALNDGFVILGNLWIFGATGWVNVGQFAGPRGDPGPSYQPSALGSLAGRAAYDASPSGFSYFDTGAGKIYFREGVAGVWAGPFDFMPGPQGIQGVKGDIGGVNATGLFADRATYDTQLVGFGFAATDTNLVYFRRTPVAGVWSDGLSLYGTSPIRIAITRAATGMAQIIALPYAVLLDDLMIFENGVEQNGDGFVINNGTELSFIRPANKVIRVVSAFSTRGPKGDPGAPGAPGAGGGAAGRPWFRTIEVLGLGAATARQVEVPIIGMNVADLEVFINGIKQPPSSLAFAANVLTFYESVTTLIMVQSR